MSVPCAAGLLSMSRYPPWLAPCFQRIPPSNVTPRRFPAGPRWRRSGRPGPWPRSRTAGAWWPSAPGTCMGRCWPTARPAVRARPTCAPVLQPGDPASSGSGSGCGLWGLGCRNRAAEEPGVDCVPLHHPLCNGCTHVRCHGPALPVGPVPSMRKMMDGTVWPFIAPLGERGPGCSAGCMPGSLKPGGRRLPASNEPARSPAAAAGVSRTCTDTPQKLRAA